MLDTRVDESAFEAELHPKLTSGRLTREDLACGRSSGLFSGARQSQHVTSPPPGPKRISSGSLDYFDDSRATPPHPGFLLLRLSGWDLRTS